MPWTGVWDGNLATWMSQLTNETRLNQVVMPGSHDAAMYIGRERRGGGQQWITDSTVTQFNDIRTQLDQGARFFDIRVYRYGGSFFGLSAGGLITGHFPSKGASSLGVGGYGPDLQEVLDHMEAFLGTNNQETILVKFSTGDGALKATLAAMVATWGTRRGGSIIYTPLGVTNIALENLGNMRGRIICLPDDAVPDTYANRFHKVSKEVPAANTALAKTTLFIQGKAPTELDLAKVQSKQKEARQSFNAEGAHVPHLKMWYLTITGGLGNLCVAQNTSKAFGIEGVPQNVQFRAKYSAWNSGVAAVAYEYEMHHGLAFDPNTVTNIIQYDFTNGEVNEVIIRRNR